MTSNLKQVTHVLNEKCSKILSGINKNDKEALAWFESQEIILKRL